MSWGVSVKSAVWEEKADESSETGVWPQGSYEWEDTVGEAEGLVGRKVMEEGCLEAGKLPV